MSSIESVQHMGSRLAHIIGGEMSRMRADLAFASATGVTVQSTHEAAESLRAQQSTLLGHHQVSLTMRSALRAQFTRHNPEGDQTQDATDEHAIERESESHQQQSSFSGEEADDESASAREESFSDESTPNEDTETLDDSLQAGAQTDALIQVLRDSLEKFGVLMQQSDFTGQPIAAVFPAAHWLERFAPAGLRAAGVAHSSCEMSDVIVLCLGFDGQLLIDHRLVSWL